MKSQSWFSFYRLVIIAIFVLLSGAFEAAAVQTIPSISSGTLGEGTTWETSWRIVDSGEPGPVVLVVGGVHGNEPAGYRAATQIQYWPIVAGKLIILPCVNRLGIAADTRWYPDFRNDRQLRDLNRNFPIGGRLEPQTPLGTAVWSFVKEQQPDWVFDLHEGFDFHRLNPKSVGSSVIAFPDNSGFAELLQQAVNSDIPEERQFELLAASGPAEGSLARACEEQLGARSFILETTFKDQSVSQRTRQHRTMVSAALKEIGLINRSCVNQLAPSDSVDRIRVAVFDAAGADEDLVVTLLDKQPNMFVCHVGPEDLQPEVLKSFDVVLFPGGSGGKQGRDIGATGRDAVRQFVSEGGGFVGICAGAYLCTSHYEWSLDLINATTFNQMVDVPKVGRKSMWYRGRPADVQVEFTDDGAAIFGNSEVKTVRYHNGPILAPGNDPSVPAFRTLALFRSEVGLYEAQKNTMIDTPAIVSSEYGQGRVVAISPHFESTPGEESVVLKAIEYVQASTDNE